MYVHVRVSMCVCVRVCLCLCEWLCPLSSPPTFLSVPQSRPSSAQVVYKKLKGRKSVLADLAGLHPSLALGLKKLLDFEGDVEVRTPRPSTFTLSLLSISLSLVILSVSVFYFSPNSSHPLSLICLLP